MSGAPEGADPCGAAVGCAGWGGDVRRTPSTMTTMITDPIATAHGRGNSPLPRGLAVIDPLVDVPQTWQKLAPGDTDELHFGQVPLVNGALQWVQNFPDAVLPHLGHVISDAAWLIYLPGFRFSANPII